MKNLVKYLKNEEKIKIPKEIIDDCKREWNEKYDRIGVIGERHIRISEVKSDDNLNVFRTNLYYYLKIVGYKKWKCVGVAYKEFIMKNGKDCEFSKPFIIYEDREDNFKIKDFG